MKCLRTLGVLLATLSVVWSATVETTSLRYLEDNFSLNNVDVNATNNNLSNIYKFYSGLKNNSGRLKLGNISLDFNNDSLLVNDNDIFNNTVNSLIITDIDFNNPNSSRESKSKDNYEDTAEGRKLKLNRRAVSKDETKISNLIRSTIKGTRTNLTKINSNKKGTGDSLKTSSIRRKTTDIKDSKNKIRLTTKTPILKITSEKVTTPTTLYKTKLSTFAPITVKLTKPTPRKPSVSTPKSYDTHTTRKALVKIKSTSSRPTKKRKPTIQKIITKWTDSVTSGSNLKQNWYEDGVPYPNPMPEITSSSPPFSITSPGNQIVSTSSASDIILEELVPGNEDVVSINPEIYSNSPSAPLQGVPPIIPSSSPEDLESLSVPAAVQDLASSNPISTFNLDMVPSGLTRLPAETGEANDCPSVHISSSVLSPLQRQGCSDLNLVLNTHYHQNQGTRNPDVSTYDAAADADDVIYAEEPILDDGLANAPPVASDAVGNSGNVGGGSPTAGGTGGSGGSGGSGGDSGGGFKLPDLKPVFDAIGYLMQGLWWLIQKLMNPWLYIIPIILFFSIGFLGIILLFPWWIPLVFLFFSVKSKEPKNEVAHVKHYHKPVLVKHPDGWFWDQKTQTWKNVVRSHEYVERRSITDTENLDDKIVGFGKKLGFEESGEHVYSSRKKRSTMQPISNYIKNISNQLLETNTSTSNFLDVRTPPRIKEKMTIKQSFESSHAGVAIPIDADIEVLEESTKKMNFYKIERPTTSNGGLSTWILLSGQSSTTVRPTTKMPSIKPIYVKDDKHNDTILGDKTKKITKPLFKQRSTTSKPVTIASTKTTTIRVNTESTSAKSASKKPAKLTRIKASLVNNNSSKTNTSFNGKNKSTTSISVPSKTTYKPTESSGSTNTLELSGTTESSQAIIDNKTSVDLPAEAKEGHQELATTDEKKKKVQKRKKNKNKRKKPSKASKEGNNKLKEVESPGTQLYSYLKSEIIPVTVGVSLVGLLVTAGLASYYLQPFAALRRNDPVDRKDTDGGYYYHDDYSNAMPEEEAIGKVIAGMPDNTLQSNSVMQSNNGNSFKPATSRNTDPQNFRYRHVDRRSQIYMNPYGSVEDVTINERERTAVNYDQGSGSYNSENKFVVGGIPKDVVQEVTPAVVPEHGPRNLKLDEKKFVVGNIPKEFFNVGASPRNLKVRRRREIIPDDSENEISPEQNEIGDLDTFNQMLPFPSTENIDITTNNGTKEITDTEATTQEAVKETTPHNVWSPSERPDSIFELITDLFRLKVKLGLELIQNVTSSVSTYVSQAKSRLGEHYRQHGSRGTAFKPRR